MLQKTFSIYGNVADDQQLFVEAGKNHIACWYKNDDGEIDAFEFFQCDDKPLKEKITEAKLYSRLLTTSTSNVEFILNTDEALCLPNNFFQNNNDLIQENFELVFGKGKQPNIITENYNNYILAAVAENEMQQLFPNAKIHLQFAALLESNSLKENSSTVYLFFYPSYFSIVAYSEEQLLFIQTRKYAAAEDVLYFVLDVFQQYKLEKSTVILTAGFIDANSKLYETLHQYLEGIQLMKADESLFTTDEFKEYAPHYFPPYANYVL